MWAIFSSFLYFALGKIIISCQNMRNLENIGQIVRAILVRTL